jgi:UDP-N-acetylglucosamine 2-epimerase (non-hydrolysing)
LINRSDKNMKITIVAGARPNFIKIASIVKAIISQQQKGKNISFRLVHTGQHYDKNMSGNFFQQLNIPDPDVNLECGSGSQAEQTAAIMVRFEKELLENKPSVIIVVGDVTSTMACTITAKKLCIDVAHVEAGIRSGDMTMPEEINRIVTDAICDHFFTTSELANTQLLKNGVQEKNIHFVGNTMIDTLNHNLNNLVEPKLWQTNNLEQKKYYLITLHRPSNVDNSANLSHLLDIILKETDNLPVVFPIHPRTRKHLDEKFLHNSKLIVAEPMSYLEFIFLIKNAKAIITDSGGITEEATVLNIPCVTLRNSTERPETITMGSNELAGTNPDNLIPFLKKIKNGEWKKSSIPPLWDGKASVRIIEKLMELYKIN